MRPLPLESSWPAAAYFGVPTLLAQDATGSSSKAGPHEAMVNQYCMGCHNERVRRADLVLDPATLANPEAAGETWEKVVRKLRAGAMPPQGMPRPDAAAMDGFLTYLEGSLDAAAEAQVDPGRATVHRLNRSEYENSVRDLLALDVDAAELLPPDDESYGFDNNADVLGVSPALLEQYVSASAKVARLAVGDPNILPKATTYKTRPDLSQTDRVRGLPLGTRGGLVEKHNFPLDGEYEFSIELATNTAEILRGLEQEHEIEILIDNARIFITKIGGPEDTKAMEKNPIVTRQEIRDRLTVRVPITAGPHHVGATFVKKNSAYEDYILQPFLRTTLDPVNEAGLPHIESMTIAGPFSIEGPGETPSRSKIFTCRPGEGVDEVACARKILAGLARQAYRRPVTDADMEPLLSFYQASRNRGNGFDQGVESAIRLILSNPQFIFRFEPEPADVAPGGVYPVSDVELASRLSYFLWSSIPDEPLLALAEQGKLRDKAVLEQQIRRMLADPKADALVDNFAAQWLFLRNMKGTFPDPQAFPNFDDNLRQDLETETKLFVDSIFRDDRSVLDLLRADYTFMNERVARHYGVNGVYGNRFRRVKLEDPNRYGLLGQASILSVTSHTTRTSPVLRGKWILSNLLGTPPPPAAARCPGAGRERGRRSAVVGARAHGVASRQSALFELP